MRVVSTAEMHEHHVMDAKLELVFTKSIEMFCESIPGEPLVARSVCASCTCRPPNLSSRRLHSAGHCADSRGHQGQDADEDFQHRRLGHHDRHGQCVNLLCVQHPALPQHRKTPSSDSSLLSLRAHADDFDSDPVGRNKLPSFYGYLPDDGNTRTVM
jgi:hypothetical protein